MGDLNSASCAASVAQLVELEFQPRTLEVMRSSPTTRQQVFFERLLPWDLICMSLPYVSQVSIYPVYLV